MFKREWAVAYVIKKKNVQELSGKQKLTNTMIDRLQNYCDIVIRPNKNDLKNMQTTVRATLFHVASSKENNWHYPHCPEKEKTAGANFIKIEQMVHTSQDQDCHYILL